MSNYKKIIEIFKSRNVLLEQLKEDNYNVEKYVGFNINEINTLFNENQLDMLLENENNKVYIKYFINKTLRINNIHEIIEDLYNIENILDKKDDLVIIIKDEPNSTYTKLQSTLFNNDGIYISIININRLQFNILKHNLVPKHIVLNVKEKEEIFKKFNIKNDDDIPDISRYDPVASVLRLRPSMLCEIYRPSKCSIISKYYRICSN